MVLLLLALVAAAVSATPAAEIQAVSFDPEAFKTFIQYNFASGCSLQSILTWSCLYCIDPFFHVVDGVTDSATKTQFFTGYTGSTIVLSFRGSKELQNWINDIDFSKTTYPGVSGAQVHSGFYSLWTSIKPTVFAQVAAAVSACPTCNTIKVVGHSLGGALSTLAALELAQAYTSLAVTAWTTGSPRVGNPAFANYYDSVVAGTQRMVANDDEAPHWGTKVMGFQHVATEIWDRTINGQPTYKVCNGGEDPTCSDSVGLLQWDFADHMFYAGIQKVDC